VGGPVVAATPEGDRLTRALGKGAHGPPAPRAVRVLHIEDDTVQQQAMALHLAAIREFNCTITPVTSEAGAIDLYRRQPFDVVLLDYHLAQGNGMGCLRQLRALDPIVPIVVVSGLARPQLAAELLEAGADDFLSKENLTSENLGEVLSAAVARADACKHRLAGAGRDDLARADAFFERVRQAAGGGGDETAMVKSLTELDDHSWPRHFSAAQIQRLVDLVCGELGRSRQDLPRKAILALFMRLFGDQATEEKDN
jgi:CheY-like chemotaxis protein